MRQYQSIIHVIGSPRREKEWGRKDIMAESFPELRKDIKSHIQKTKKTTSSLNIKGKKQFPGHFIVKFLKTKWKEHFENSQRKTPKYKGYKKLNIMDYTFQIKYNGLDIPNKKDMSRKDLEKSQKYIVRNALYI